MNATLLLAFAAAWVSDQWPQFAVPAIACACFVVLGEAVLLYLTAKHARACKEPPPKEPEHQNIQEETLHTTPAPAAPAEERSVVDLVGDFYRREMVGNVYAQKVLALNMHTFEYGHEAIVELLASQLAMRRPSDTWAAYVALRRLRASHGLPSTPDELSKWPLITHAPDSFNIRAGSFEIEHFHGQTNIRVLDLSRVTVEGQRRGAKLKSAPPGIQAPVYQ